MEPIEVLGVEHIDVTVNDLARSTAFYDKVMPALGFRRLPDNDRDNIRWANAHLTFAIRPASLSARRDFNRYRVGLHHLHSRPRAAMRSMSSIASCFAKTADPRSRRPSIRFMAQITMRCSLPIPTA